MRTLIRRFGYWLIRVTDKKYDFPAPKNYMGSGIPKDWDKRK